MLDCKVAKGNAKMKYYVVADVHGFYDLMIEALTEKGYFTDAAPHKLIICGDLFDRGKQSKELLEFVLGLLKKDEVILIRGNHEDLLVDFVEKLPMYAGMGFQYTHHYSNGTVHTVRDLTRSTLTKMSMYPEATAAGMKRSELFKTVLPAMKNYYETKNYIFVHGWIPSIANGMGGSASFFQFNPEWRNDDAAGWYFARWYNGMLAAHQGVIEPGKTIVCGHWHTSFGHSRYEGKGAEFGEGEDFSPYYADGIIALDACTGHSKKVNCIVLEDDDLPNIDET